MSSGRQLVQENPSISWFEFHFFEESHVIGKAVGSGNSVREKFVGKKQVLVCMRESNHRSLIYAAAYIFIHICTYSWGVAPGLV